MNDGGVHRTFYGSKKRLVFKSQMVHNFRWDERVPHPFCMEAYHGFKAFP